MILYIVPTKYFEGRLWFCRLFCRLASLIFRTLFSFEGVILLLVSLSIYEVLTPMFFLNWKNSLKEPSYLWNFVCLCLVY